MRRRTARVGAVGLVGVLVPLGLASCALLPHTSSCADYISLPSPAERFQAAPIVVVAEVTATDRTANATGRYEVHRARITEVLKGTMQDHAIDVINPSDQCTTGGEPVTYVERDELTRSDGSSRVLYLADRDGAPVWRLLVPNALDPASVASDLPTTK